MNPLILVVEDESAIADTIVYALKTEGFEAERVAEGGRAFERLKNGGIDLVVLDVGLPDWNGFDLCKEIRLGDPRLPVIFLTARSEEVDRIVGLEIGADDYMVKPFSPRELTARIRAVLRRASGGAASAEEPARESVSGSPFEIDEKRRTIRYFGSPLELSRYEYGILAMLAERPGWVFSREQLMERVWDVPEASFDRTVDRHVKNIRDKLEAVRPGEDPIVTRRGQGYALREDW